MRLQYVFSNHNKTGVIPVRKREDNDFLFFKYVTNKNKEKAAPEEIKQEDEEEQSSN
jgi:hypothetical protein